MVIHGLFFSPEDSVKVTFDGTLAAEMVVVDSGEIHVITPPGLPGTVDVTVFNDDGTSTGSFTYVSVD